MVEACEHCWNPALSQLQTTKCLPNMIPFISGMVCFYCRKSWHLILNFQILVRSHWLARTCAHMNFLAALDIRASMATNSWSSSFPMAVCVMRIIPITETTVWSVKKVSLLSIICPLTDDLESVDWPSCYQRTQTDCRGEWNHQVRQFYDRPFQYILTQLLREDDSNWPKKNIVGKQELEIRIGNDHIAFEVNYSHESYILFDHWYHTKTAKIGSLVDIQDSEDPEGLRVFYYLVQDLKVGVLHYPYWRACTNRRSFSA